MGRLFYCYDYGEVGVFFWVDVIFYLNFYVFILYFYFFLVKVIYILDVKILVVE